MVVCVTARFKGTENKTDIEALCSAVHAAGLEDFSFIRDVENYQKTFDDPKELWDRARIEISACDALLIDISDVPSGGRIIEVGMAFALDIPIVVVVKKGVAHKEIYDGVAEEIIEYETYKDITKALKMWHANLASAL